MNKQIEIGKINSLIVERESKYGLYLRAENFNEVLLPNAYVVEKKMPIGAVIDVFIYTDFKDRLVASTQYPYAMLGEFGYFKVVEIKQYGSFVDWGLPKDLFVPLSQQRGQFEMGKKYILRVCQDKETGRLYGTNKIGKWLSFKPKDLKRNQKVSILVISKTPLGYKAVVENLYEGMLFNNEIFQKLSVGDKKIAYIKNIRGDGKLDLSLQPIGKKSLINSYEKKILDVLHKRGGSMKIGSKSDASTIKELFSMSKKSFKMAFNSLLNKKKIIQDDLGVVRTNKKQ